MSGQGKLIISTDSKSVAVSKDLLILLLVFSFLPVFRCGLRDHINFWVWIKEHTVWGHKVEYIPAENYGEQPTT